MADSNSQHESPEAIFEALGRFIYSWNSVEVSARRLLMLICGHVDVAHAMDAPGQILAAGLSGIGLESALRAAAEELLVGEEQALTRDVCARYHTARMDRNEAAHAFNTVDILVSFDAAAEDYAVASTSAWMKSDRIDKKGLSSKLVPATAAAFEEKIADQLQLYLAIERLYSRQHARLYPSEEA